MEHLPAEKEVRVVEPEIVGLELPPPSLWRRIAAKVAVSLFVGLVGLGLCAIGVVLTLTIVGAWMGIPLVLVGIGLIVFSVFLLIGGGKIRVGTIKGTWG